jgi:hypothetical protein
MSARSMAGAQTAAGLSGATCTARCITRQRRTPTKLHARSYSPTLLPGVSRTDVSHGTGGDGAKPAGDHDADTGVRQSNAEATDPRTRDALLQPDATTELHASGHVSFRERPGLADPFGTSTRGLQDRSRLHGTACGEKGRGEREKT